MLIIRFDWSCFSRRLKGLPVGQRGRERERERVRPAGLRGADNKQTGPFLDLRQSDKKMVSPASYGDLETRSNHRWGRGAGPADAPQ